MALIINVSGLHPEAGCDEAGRGCLAGPVTAATVILPDGFNCPKLNDSKQLTVSQRNELSVIIKREALAWAVAFTDNHEIDKINILKASILSMHRAVDNLSMKPAFLVIDGNRFYKYPGIGHTCVVKGDAKVMSIAAASVLAKTARDAYMDALHLDFPHYAWNRNKGYPTRQHRAAIKAFGPSIHHRLTFNLLPEDGNSQTSLQL